MKNIKIFLSIQFLFLGTVGCAQQAPNNSIYSYKQADPDGIGKVYMGREIASVMSFEGVSWLERNTRQQEENTALAIAKLPVSKSSIVADIGAGSGYYTFKIAPKIPLGKVYAVEIQEDALNFLRKRSKQLRLNNVVVVKGTDKSPGLPDNAIDLAIMVDVYHELSNPQEVLQALKKSLKPKGKLLLLEYRGENPEVAIKKTHKMTVAQVKKELTANGFHLLKNGQFMPIQHYLIFEKN